MGNQCMSYQVCFALTDSICNVSVFEACSMDGSECTDTDARYAVLRMKSKIIRVVYGLMHCKYK